MAQPFSYLLNVPNPAEAVTSGLQQGVQLASMMERTDALAAQRRQTELENQALQVKAQRAQQFQGELGKLGAEGFTAKGLNELMIRFPEAAKQLEAQYTNLGTQERQARVDALLPVAAAVNAGDNVSAQLVLRDQIEALTNSGKADEAKAAGRMLDLITTNPAAAKSTLNLATAGAMGMDKYADTVVKLEGSRREEEFQPGKLRKLAGEAEEAETKGRLAEKKIKGEIAKDTAAAFASSASAKKSLAEAKTEEEKRSASVDLLIAQAALTRSKIEKAMGNPEDARQGALATIDVIDKVIKNEGDARSILGTWNAIPKTFNMKGLEGIKLGAWKPQAAMSEKELDVLANINELGGKTFLQQAQKMRGLGQLTEIEGKKVVEAAGNLSREQSPDRFMATLRTMREALAAGAARKPGSVPKGELIFGDGGTVQGGGPAATTDGMSDETLMKALGL